MAFIIKQNVTSGKRAGCCAEKIRLYNKFIMSEHPNSNRLLEELRQASQKGLIAGDVVQLAQSVFVGGNVSGGTIVTGDNNVVITTGVPVETKKADEETLLAEAVGAYQADQHKQLQLGSAQPYPGLAAYRLQDARHFLGRRQPITEVTDLLHAARVVWLHGRSGTGKSSLLQAGLLPALLERNIVPIFVRPFDELPTTALKKELLKHRWSADLDLAGESLNQFMARLVYQLAGQTICVFFDQFEEFFSKLEAAQREPFARDLADCVANTNLPVHFLFSLRSEYFGDTALLRERLQADASREYFLRPLTAQEARLVITGPMEQRGITYQTGLVETILGQLGGEEVDSPQLQLVCERLFRSLPPGETQITTSLFDSLGETKGILTDYLKQALRDPQVIPADRQKAAMYLLSTLVTPEAERDAKTLSDWAMNERFHSLTLAWYAQREHLPLGADRPSPQTIRRFAVASLIGQIEPHVSMSSAELRTMIEEGFARDPEPYIHQMYRAFVREIVQFLRQARLLHDVQAEDGGVAYELMHDYLIPEVQGWFGADEQDARRLRQMLSQRQVDFARYKIYLDVKELELVAAQLENPKLELREADKKLLLLSAAAHGTGARWLALCGLIGPTWLAEALDSDDSPEALRLGAAACLGEAGDSQTFHHLLARVQENGRAADSSLWLDLLAHYLSRSSKKHNLPRSVKRALFSRLAQLEVADAAAARRRMSRGILFLVPCCVAILFGFTLADPTTNAGWLDFLITLAIFAIVGGAVGLYCARWLTSLVYLQRALPDVSLTLFLLIVGSAFGLVIFFAITGSTELLLVGAVTGTLLAGIQLAAVWRPGRFLALLSPLLGLGVAWLVFSVSSTSTISRFGESISAGVFTAGYILLAAFKRSLARYS